jgi:hypothetical protein
MSFNRKPAKNNIRVLLASALMAMFLSLAIVAETANAQVLSMPEEYVNYTITRVDGVLWAKIDGTYPISYAGNDEPIPMVYPTPPGTTNISLSLDDVALEWGNFTQLHHTAIGDWQEIVTVLEPVSKSFVLKIHYEHPLQVINGSYAFLYDLNILEYLSEAANKSVAHFTIRMETEYANLNVNTVFGTQETLKPIDFTVSGEKPVEIKIDEVSEFEKPLPGDLLVSFTDAKTPETPETPDTSWIIALALIVGLVVVALAVYVMFLRRRKREAHDSAA